MFDSGECSVKVSTITCENAFQAICWELIKEN